MESIHAPVKDFTLNEFYRKFPKLQIIGLCESSDRWNEPISYSGPDWYSLYTDEDGFNKFYRGVFPTYCRIKITE